MKTEHSITLLCLLLAVHGINASKDGMPSEDKDSIDEYSDEFRHALEKLQEAIDKESTSREHDESEESLQVLRDNENTDERNDDRNSSDDEIHFPDEMKSQIFMNSWSHNIEDSNGDLFEERKRPFVLSGWRRQFGKRKDESSDDYFDEDKRPFVLNGWRRQFGKRNEYDDEHLYEEKRPFVLNGWRRKFGKRGNDRFIEEKRPFVLSGWRRKFGKRGGEYISDEKTDEEMKSFDSGEDQSNEYFMENKRPLVLSGGRYRYKFGKRSSPLTSNHNRDQYDEFLDDTNNKNSEHIHSKFDRVSKRPFLMSLHGSNRKRPSKEKHARHFLPYLGSGFRFGKRGHWSSSNDNHVNRDVSSIFFGRPVYRPSFPKRDSYMNLYSLVHGKFADQPISEFSPRFLHFRHDFALDQEREFPKAQPRSPNVQKRPFSLGGGYRSRFGKRVVL